MNIYLDDDSARDLLVRLLLRDGHQVLIPVNAGLVGAPDPVHFRHAINNNRVLLTYNHQDFNLLHQLVLAAGGGHPGLLTVRRDNDASKDLQPKAIAHALRNLAKAAIPIENCLNVLNHWR